MVSRPNRRAERRRPRPSRGPPGPGTAIIVVAVAVLAILAVLGLTGGSGGGGGGGSKSSTSAKKATKKKHHKKKRKVVAKPTSVRLKIVPTGATYLCVDHGAGTPGLVNGTVSTPQTFKGKRLRANIGIAANVRVFSNGKRVPITTQAISIAWEFTPSKSKQLPAGERPPCA
jgi:hypothetical protein